MNVDWFPHCVQGWGLLKLHSLISPLREILIEQKAAVTSVKHELDIIQVTNVFIILKNWENNGTEKIGLVTPTPGVLEIFHWIIDVE